MFLRVLTCVLIMKRFFLKNASTSIFTIMLLIGSAFLMGADVSFQFRGLNGGNVWFDQSDSWQNKNDECGASLMADVLDDGNIVGTFSTSISRSYHGEVVRQPGNEIDAVRYSAYSSAYAGSGWEGRGNAWVKVPGNERAHDANRNGGVDIGGDGEPSGVSAWDSVLRASDALNRRASTSASLWQGGVSASAGISISGF